LKKKQSNKQKSAKKQAQKTSKFQLNQATRKSSKKPAPSKKNKPKFAGKPQGWQHCTNSTVYLLTCSADIPTVVCNEAVR